MTRNQVIRKTLYAIVAAVLGLLAIFGIVTVEQADQWTSTAYQILEIVAPLVGAGSLTLAASKVHRGSDSHVTKEDMLLAESKARTDAEGEAPAVMFFNVAGEAEVEPAPVDEDTLAEAARAYQQMTRRPQG